SIQGLAKDSADKFRVDADGGNFVFWLNDKPVTQINDGDYVNGEVGFFVETFDESLAHIHYDTLTIRQIEGEGVPLPVGGVLAEDDFTDPGTGWPVLAGDEESTSLFGYHPPDFYHVEVSAEQVSEVVSKGPAFADVTVESELFVEKTDSDNGDFRYGLALRRTNDNFYAFTISSRTDSWYILKSSVDGLEVLDEGSEDSIKGDGRANLNVLRVDAEGDEFIFYIDGRPVSILSDADYPEGEVGFFVENFDEPLAHIHFDTLKISEVGFK
ncbi:MAG: hypothetical protein R3264_15570, partial [Anaerolineae bacterium]|nr:hypothetical protein [Anaerolineae bacterium]